MTLIVERQNDINVDFTIVVVGIDCFFGTAERTLDGLRGSKKIGWSQLRRNDAADVTESMLAGETPRLRVIKRRAA